MLLSILAHLGYDHGAHHAVPLVIALGAAAATAVKKWRARLAARREVSR